MTKTEVFAMKILASVVAMVFVAAMLAAAAYGGYWAVRDLVEGYRQLELANRATLAAAGVMTLVGSLVVAAGLRSAARLLRQKGLDEPRWELYRRAAAWALRRAGRGHAAGESAVAIGEELVLVGGPAVIRAWVALQAAGSPAQFEAGVAGLLREMRRELGHAPGYEESRLPWPALVAPDRATGPTTVRPQPDTR